MKIENFLGIKNQRNFLEGLKQKLSIFIRTKKYI